MNGNSPDGIVYQMLALLSPVVTWRVHGFRIRLHVDLGSDSWPLRRPQRRTRGDTGMNVPMSGISS